MEPLLFVVGLFVLWLLVRSMRPRDSKVDMIAQLHRELLTLNMGKGTLVEAQLGYERRVNPNLTVCSTYKSAIRRRRRRLG